MVLCEKETSKQSFSSPDRDFSQLVSLCFERYTGGLRDPHNYGFKLNSGELHFLVSDYLCVIQMPKHARLCFRSFYASGARRQRRIRVCVHSFVVCGKLRAMQILPDSLCGHLNYFKNILTTCQIN
jgi:hypothetical protein